MTFETAAAVVDRMTSATCNALAFMISPRQMTSRHGVAKRRRAQRCVLQRAGHIYARTWAVEGVRVGARRAVLELRMIRLCDGRPAGPTRGRGSLARCHGNRARVQT